MLNIYTKFHESTFDSFNVTEGIRFPYRSGYNCQIKITKGHSSMRNVGGDMVIVLCTPSDDGLYFYKKI